MIGRWTGNPTLGAQESLYHDLLRVVLLLQVIIGHVVAIALPQMPLLIADPAGNAAEIMLKLLARYGPQAAYLFVFLSGYMVAGPMLGDAVKQAPLSFPLFVQKRLRKLLPGVFLGLAVTACLDGLAIFALGKSVFYQDVMGLNVLTTYRLDILLGNFLFLEPTFVPAFGSNGPLWTLGYIFQYYLAGFALFRMLRLNGLAGLVFALLLIGFPAFVRPEWSILFVVWLLGGWVRNIRVSGISASVLLTAGLALFLISNLLPPLYSAAASGLVGMALAFGLQQARPSAFDKLAPTIRSAAAQTYLSYAVHFPIVVFAAAVVDGKLPPLAAFCAVMAVTTLGILVLTVVNRAANTFFRGTSEQRQG